LNISIWHLITVFSILFTLRINVIKNYDQKNSNYFWVPENCGLNMIKSTNLMRKLITLSTVLLKTCHIHCKW